jgi:hypothetical protein
MGMMVDAMKHELTFPQYVVDQASV